MHPAAAAQHLDIPTQLLRHLIAAGHITCNDDGTIPPQQLAALQQRQARARRRTNQ